MRVLAILIAGAALFAADPYPQWRGSDRDGHAKAFQPPQQWPRTLKLQWSAGVGEGYSTPVVSASAVCVHARQGGDEIISCLDRATGKPLWQDRHAAPFTKNSYARRMSSGPFATPLLHQDTLFTLGVNAELRSYDVKTGKLRWRRAPSRAPVTSGNFCGAAVSPLLDQNRLIVFWGDDQGGELVALNPASGNTLWTWNGDHPVYSSPVVATLAGVRQYVMLAEKNAVGIEAATGKLMWRIPYADEWNENIVTPVVSGDTLILSGVRKPTAAYAIERRGGVIEPRALWSAADVPMYMSSPVLDANLLYGFTSRGKGRLFTLDVTTGKTLWQSEGRYADHASLTIAGPWLVLYTDSGELIVATKGAAPKEVARYDLGRAPAWALPVLAGRQIFLKDDIGLRAYTLP